MTTNRSYTVTTQESAISYAGLDLVSAERRAQEIADEHGESVEITDDAGAIVATSEPERRTIDGTTLSQWNTLPEDQGQSCRVDYAVDWEAGVLVRRTRAPGAPIEYEVAAIDGGEFAPWNGRLPEIVSEWEPCEVA